MNNNKEKDKNHEDNTSAFKFLQLGNKPTGSGEHEPKERDMLFTAAAAQPLGDGMRQFQSNHESDNPYRAVYRSVGHKETTRSLGGISHHVSSAPSSSLLFSGGKQKHMHMNSLSIGYQGGMTSLQANSVQNMNATPSFGLNAPPFANRSDQVGAMHNSPFLKQLASKGKAEALSTSSGSVSKNQNPPPHLSICPLAMTHFYFTEENLDFLNAMEVILDKHGVDYEFDNTTFEYDIVFYSEVNEAVCIKLYIFSVNSKTGVSGLKLVEAVCQKGCRMAYYQFFKKLKDQLIEKKLLVNKQGHSVNKTRKRGNSAELGSSTKVSRPTLSRQSSSSSNLPIPSKMFSTTEENENETVSCSLYRCVAMYKMARSVYCDIKLQGFEGLVRATRDSRTEKKKLCSIPGAVKFLVDSVKDRNQCISRSALTIISNLTADKNDMELLNIVVESGAVPELISIAKATNSNSNSATPPPPPSSSSAYGHDINIIDVHQTRAFDALAFKESKRKSARCLQNICCSGADLKQRVTSLGGVDLLRSLRETTDDSKLRSLITI